MTEAGTNYNPYQAPATNETPLNTDRAGNEPAFGSRVMVGLSFLFVFCGMVLIGMILSIALVTMVRPTRDPVSVTIAVLMIAAWLPVSLLVARANLKQARALQLRRGGPD